eukprot:g2082.t1
MNSISLSEFKDRGKTIEKNTDTLTVDDSKSDSIVDNESKNVTQTSSSIRQTLRKVGHQFTRPLIRIIICVIVIVVASLVAISIVQYEESQRVINDEVNNLFNYTAMFAAGEIDHQEVLAASIVKQLTIGFRQEIITAKQREETALWFMQASRMFHYLAPFFHKFSAVNDVIFVSPSLPAVLITNGTSLAWIVRNGPALNSYLNVSQNATLGCMFVDNSFKDENWSPTSTQWQDPSYLVSCNPAFYNVTNSFSFYNQAINKTGEVVQNIYLETPLQRKMNLFQNGDTLYAQTVFSDYNPNDFLGVVAIGISPVKVTDNLVLGERSESNFFNNLLVLDANIRKEDPYIVTMSNKAELQKVLGKIGFQENKTYSPEVNAAMSVLKNIHGYQDILTFNGSKDVQLLSREIYQVDSETVDSNSSVKPFSANLLFSKGDYRIFMQGSVLRGTDKIFDNVSDLELNSYAVVVTNENLYTSQYVLTAVYASIGVIVGLVIVSLVAFFILRLDCTQKCMRKRFSQHEEFARDAQMLHDVFQGREEHRQQQDFKNQYVFTLLILATLGMLIAIAVVWEAETNTTINHIIRLRKGLQTDTVQRAINNYVELTDFSDAFTTSLLPIILYPAGKSSDWRNETFINATRLNQNFTITYADTKSDQSSTLDLVTLPKESSSYFDQVRIVPINGGVRLIDDAAMPQFPNVWPASQARAMNDQLSRAMQIQKMICAVITFNPSATLIIYTANSNGETYICGGELFWKASLADNNILPEDRDRMAKKPITSMVGNNWTEYLALNTFDIDNNKYYLNPLLNWSTANQSDMYPSDTSLNVLIRPWYLQAMAINNSKLHERYETWTPVYVYKTPADVLGFTKVSKFNSSASGLYDNGNPPSWEEYQILDRTNNTELLGANFSVEPVNWVNAIDGTLDFMQDIVNLYQNSVGNEGGELIVVESNGDVVASTADTVFKYKEAKQSDQQSTTKCVQERTKVASRNDSRISPSIKLLEKINEGDWSSVSYRGLIDFGSTEGTSYVSVQPLATLDTLDWTLISVTPSFYYDAQNARIHNQIVLIVILVLICAMFSIIMMGSTFQELDFERVVASVHLSPKANSFLEKASSSLGLAGNVKETTVEEPRLKILLRKHWKALTAMSGVTKARKVAAKFMSKKMVVDEDEIDIGINLVYAQMRLLPKLLAAVTYEVRMLQLNSDLALRIEEQLQTTKTSAKSDDIIANSKGTYVKREVAKPGYRIGTTVADPKEERDNDETEHDRKIFIESPSNSNLSTNRSSLENDTLGNFHYGEGIKRAKRESKFLWSDDLHIGLDDHSMLLFNAKKRLLQKRISEAESYDKTFRYRMAWIFIEKTNVDMFQTLSYKAKGKSNIFMHHCIYNSFVYKDVITLIIYCLHLIAAFFEAPFHGYTYLSPFDNQAIGIALNGLCSNFELLDAFFFLWIVSHSWTSERPLHWTGYARLLVSFALFADFWVVFSFFMWAVSNGAVQSSPNTFYEYPAQQTTTLQQLQLTLPIYLPYTAPLRPLLFLFRYETIGKTLRDIVRTLHYGAKVFYIIVLMILIAAIYAVLLFCSKGIHYDDFLDSMITSYVFMMGSENYVEQIVPVVKCSQLPNYLPQWSYSLQIPGRSNNFTNQPELCLNTFYFIYFVIFSFVGTFVLVSLVIALFQDDFEARMQDLAEDESTKRRLGFLGSFMLLDKSLDNSLQREEFQQFVNVSASRIGVDSIDYGSNVQSKFDLNAQKFITLLEEIFLNSPHHHDALVSSLQRLRRIHENIFYLPHNLIRGNRVAIFHSLRSGRSNSSNKNDSANDVLELRNIKSLRKTLRSGRSGRSVFTTDLEDSESTNSLDDLSQIIGQHKVEDSSKDKGTDDRDTESLIPVFAKKLSWQESLRKVSVKDGIAIEVSDRFLRQDSEDSEDSSPSPLPRPLQGGSFGLGVGFPDSYYVYGSNDASRIFTALVLLRCFSIIPSIQRIVFGFIVMLSLYTHVFTILFLIIYIYACVGVYIFGGSMFFAYDFQQYLVLGFDSFQSSLMTLYRIFVGEGWNDIMNLGVRTLNSPNILVYFLSYALFVQSLFANMLIGIVVSSYQSLHKRVCTLPLSESISTMEFRRLVRSPVSKTKSPIAKYFKVKWIDVWIKGTDSEDDENTVSYNRRRMHKCGQCRASRNTHIRKTMLILEPVKKNNASKRLAKLRALKKGKLY